MAYTRCGIAVPKTHTASQITVAKTPLASFESNVSGLYIPEILAYIQATQAGTGDPSPINPMAINGVSEVTTACNAINQWDEEWELGSFDSTGNPIPSTTSIRSKNYIPVKPSTSYYFQFNNSNSAKLYVIQYNARKEFISYLPYTTGIPSPRAITTASNCSFIKLDFASAYGTTYLNDCSINYPATDTAYHAYTGTTATTDLGGTYYGGYVNVQTGLLTVNWGMLDLSSVNWELTTNRARTTTLNGLAKNPPSTTRPANMKAEKYLCVASSDTLTDGDFAYLPINNVGTLLFYYDGVNKPTDKLIYELATPQTYQLTPAQLEQLLGENNVFCSSGDVAVKGWKID